jgi:hypothetical protein
MTVESADGPMAEYVTTIEASSAFNVRGETGKKTGGRQRSTQTKKKKQCL